MVVRALLIVMDLLEGVVPASLVVMDLVEGVAQASPVVMDQLVDAVLAHLVVTVQQDYVALVPFDEATGAAVEALFLEEILVMVGNVVPPGVECIEEIVVL